MVINVSEVNSASKFRLVPTIKKHVGFVLYYVTITNAGAHTDLL